jgi:hypothetical protein
MIATHCLRTLVSLVLLTAFGVPAAAATAVLTLDYAHDPAGDNDGRVVVLLDVDGYWKTVQNPNVVWRMRIDASWNWTNAPDSVNHWIQSRPSGYPYEANVLTCGDLSTCHHTQFYHPPQDSPFHRNVSVPYTTVFSDEGIGVDPASQCHGRREELLQQGMQLRQVLGNDQIIQRSARSSLLLAGKDLWVRKDIEVPLTILCKGDAQIAEALDPYPTLASQFQVTGASLTIEPGHRLERQCPAELTFSGRIHTAGTGPATVQYRFEWPTGQRSTLFTATVADASQGAEVVHKVAIPLTPAFVPGAHGGGGGLSPGGGGFAAVQPPPPPPGPLPEGVPEPSRGPVFKGATLPANEHKNDVRLVVISHGGAVSHPAAYHIVCAPRVTDGIRGPGGMTLPPPAPESRGADTVRPALRGVPPDMTREAPSAPKAGDITLKRGTTDDNDPSRPEPPALRESDSVR